ncbi:6-phospho 3-hexuloisomerase [Streptomyces viridiviolaceus]|uniref:6-phospho-3-hexuloisomerase n=1 Tax=Streptomyces viridiviolaceus TaxID=68282 RepID=A0ABW2E135_9ACTN|nr:6-phospho-3-hexuloisomerase [Streptomyces viridiviolaceus]GHB75764.1 6-phospho 3-hexuloisomerase [Streptomyces viridiviolaceus]
MSASVSESSATVRHGWRESTAVILSEVAEALAAVDAHEMDLLLSELDSPARVFVFGQGRSGIALRSFAMRLMHLGAEVHVIGETTTPAIRAGDVLIVASGSGSTPSVVAAARTALTVGARVVAVTAVHDSPLAEAASVVVHVPAAAKRDHSLRASVQYAGSLFEQAVSLLADAAFHTLWLRSGATAEDLWDRHANLE